MYSIDVWVVPSWGNQNIKQKREKPMGFPTKMAPKGHYDNFFKVWIGLWNLPSSYN